MDQAAVWDETVGAAWVRHADFLEAHSEAFGQAALSRLGDVAGERVLDVGCGTGTTTRALAAAGAHAVGVDLSTRMLAHARSRPAPGPGRVEFVHADVTTLEPAAPFDAVFSRFGVMFFADAVAGFTSLRNLAADGGRLAFASWTDPFANPWMLVPVMASAEALGPPPLPGPGEPGPFSLGTEDRIREVLGGAGWSDIAVEVVDAEMTFPGADAGAVAAVFIEMNPFIALGLAAAPEHTDAVRDAVARDLAPHEGADGSVRLAGQVLVTSARR